MRIDLSRRHFLASVGTAVAALILPRRAAAERWPAPPKHVHPTPRPDVDASKVLTADELKDYADAVPIFDKIREIPEIADGIRCHCGCAGHPGFYSLLSCFEKDGMGTYCATCHDEARLVFDLHKQGKTLDEIRAAICAKFD